MKTKVFKLVLVVVLGAFVVYGCNKDDSSIIPTGNGVICNDFGNDNIAKLEVKLIHEMTSRYRENQNLEINAGLGIDDANSIWFALDTIKAFIYHLENEGRAREITADRLGIRFYYSSYPVTGAGSEYDDLKGIPENYEMLHTLIGVPTINREGLDYDFNPVDPDTYEFRMQDVTNNDYSQLSTARTSVLAASRQTSGSSGTTGSQNHGTLIPPGASQPVRAFDN